MSYRIVGDSCSDLTKKQIDKGYFVSIPLTISVEGVEVVDDDTFDQEIFLKKVKESEECPKSSCPSPDAFMRNFRGVDDVYVVTLSSKLSGSYNSAELAKQLYQEDHEDVNIHVFDSKGAASGQNLICEQIENCLQAGMKFNEVVKKVEAYIKKQEILFVLEDLDSLRKNGRMTKVKSIVANALNIKPVLTAIDGEIHQLDQARGINKALNKLIRHIDKMDVDKNRKVAISHCDCIARAKNMKKVLMETLGFKDVVILEGGGITSLYANAGGIIVSF